MIIPRVSLVKEEVGMTQETRLFFEGFYLMAQVLAFLSGYLAMPDGSGKEMARSPSTTRIQRSPITLGVVR
ncbi:MAG TPA: hypothetical protein VJI73_01660 [Candidatus Paceibacterota bacterium]